MWPSKQGTAGNRRTGIPLVGSEISQPIRRCKFAAPELQNLEKLCGDPRVGEKNTHAKSPGRKIIFWIILQISRVCNHFGRKNNTLKSQKWYLLFCEQIFFENTWRELCLFFFLKNSFCVSWFLCSWAARPLILRHAAFVLTPTRAHKKKKKNHGYPRQAVGPSEVGASFFFLQISSLSLATRASFSRSREKYYITGRDRPPISLIFSDFFFFSSFFFNNVVCIKKIHC